MEEERRLCYVGITRAKEKLFMTYAETRTLFGTTKYNMKSRFLKEISKELICEEKYKSANDDLFQYAGFKKPQMDTSMFKAQPKSAVQTETAENLDFEIGDRVMHRKFGEGTILEAKAIGADMFLRVKFDDVGEKNLMAAYVKLEKL